MQSHLLPPSPSDWLPDGHLAYFILDVIAPFEALREVRSGDRSGSCKTGCKGPGSRIEGIIEPSKRDSARSEEDGLRTARTRKTDRQRRKTVQARKLRNGLRSSRRWPGRGLQFRQPPRERKKPLPQLNLRDRPFPLPSRRISPVHRSPRPAPAQSSDPQIQWSRERVEGGLGYSRAKPRRSTWGMTAQRARRGEHGECRRPSSGVDRRPPAYVERGPWAGGGTPVSGDGSKVRRARHSPPSAFTGGQICQVNGVGPKSVCRIAGGPFAALRPASRPAASSAT
jgi:hypothetical protein